ncbi:MAG: hypothetical protein J0I68_00005, partial [Achromobacter sp.]|uniref:FecR family protein n=1 Tax=Achromobacter sp. TaxID=134375 RepID=UPI001ACA32F7|nr:hypothetical protein [Achromobacter sp.]
LSTDVQSRAGRLTPRSPDKRRAAPQAVTRGTGLEWTPVAAGGERFTMRKATFNVRTSERETCVTCLTGAMQQQNGAAPARLAAGQQLVVRADGETQLGAVDPVRVLGWRQGLLIFRNTPLAEAIEDINRYRSARIILTDKALAHRPVNGMFHTDQIENAVVQIQQLMHINVRHLPGGVTLLG